MHQDSIVSNIASTYGTIKKEGKLDNNLEDWNVVREKFLSGPETELAFLDIHVSMLSTYYPSQVQYACC